VKTYGMLQSECFHVSCPAIGAWHKYDGSGFLSDGSDEAFCDTVLPVFTDSAEGQILLLFHTRFPETFGGIHPILCTN